MWKHKPLTGRDLIQWLAAAGIDVDSAYRVVIDAKASDIVRIYVERFGDERMISVKPPDLAGAEVITEPRGAEKQVS